MNALIVTCIAACLVCVGLGFAISRRRDAAALSELAQLKNRYRRLYGWSEGYGTYDLESFDIGRTWYAMWTLPDGRRLVRGHAEQIHPGILSEPWILGDNLPIGNSEEHCSDLTVEDELSIVFEALEKQIQRKLEPVAVPKMDKHKLCGRFLLSEIMTGLRQNSK